MRLLQQFFESAFQLLGVAVALLDVQFQSGSLFPTLRLSQFLPELVLGVHHFFDGHQKRDRLVVKVVFAVQFFLLLE